MPMRIAPISASRLLRWLCAVQLWLILLPAVTAQAQISVVPTMHTAAGNGTAGSGGNNGPATAAELSQPYGVAEDAAGNIYIADTNNSVIRKVTAGTGLIAIVAGNGNYGYSGDGGSATAASLAYPTDVTLDGAGNIYIADTNNNVIREVAAGTGIITTVAGSGNYGYSGDGGLATSAQLKQPYGVAVDGAGNLYIADTDNSRIREVAAGTGIITTVAGNGSLGYSGDGGPATAADLDYPVGVAVDPSGAIYIADYSCVVRKVSAGIIVTVAGNGTPGYSGDGGPATAAELNDPFGVKVDTAGNLYIADSVNGVIREVAAKTQIISTVAGDGTLGYSGDNGAASAAEMNYPQRLALDASGNLLIADTINNVIREVSTPPVFASIPVGSNSATQNVLFETTTAESIASISVPASLGGAKEFTVGTVTGCVVGSGSNPANTICTVPVTFSPVWAGERAVPLEIVTGAGTVAVGLTGLATAPQVALTPGIITTVAGNGTAGLSGNNGPATAAELNQPFGAVADAAGNIYVADTNNSVIRKIAAGTGTITAVAGNGNYGYSGDGGPATAAELAYPTGIALDSAGNIYIADTYNNVIRKIAAGTGTITTVAGNGTAGYSGDGGLASAAELNQPYGVAVDAPGNLYVADTYNNVIRKVALGTGTITTVAGSGTLGYSGDGGPATAAKLVYPVAVTVDVAGNLYIADYSSAIRKVTASTEIIATVAGNGTAGYSGDGGPATSAELNNPFSVAVDAAGDLYVADTFNAAIREVSAATGSITTIAGTGKQGYGGDNGLATAAELDAPQRVTLDSAGNLYIADSYNNVIRKVTVTTTALSYLPTAVGATSSDSPKTVAVSNIGNAALTLPALTSGPHPSIPAGFQYDSAGTCPQLSASAADTTLPSGDGCTLAIDFVPVAAGTTSGTAVLTDNALNASGAQQLIALNGAGALITLTPTALPTGTYGAAYSAQTVTAVGGTAPYSYVVLSGTLPAGLTLTPSGVLAGTPAVTGSFPLSVEATDSEGFTGMHNYALTVTKAATTTGLSVSSANSIAGTGVVLTATVASATTGTPTGTVSFYEGTTLLATMTLANGTASYTSTTLPSGSDTLTAGYSGDSNFLPSDSTASSIVIAPVPGFTLTGGTPASQSVPPGGSVTYSLAVAPTAGGYPGTVTFSVAGLPPGATASFSPSSVAANDGPQNISMTVQTSTTTARLAEQGLLRVTLAWLLLPLLGIRRMRRQARSMGMLCSLLAGILAATALLSGCGVSFQQSQRSYPLTVTATSGSQQEQVSFTLTQP